MFFHHSFKQAFASSVAYFKQAFTFIYDCRKNVICIGHSDEYRYTVCIKAYKQIVTAAFLFILANAAGNINTISPITVDIAYKFSDIDIMRKTFIHKLSLPKNISAARKTLPPYYLYRLFNNLCYNSRHIAVFGIYPCNNKTNHIALCRSPSVIICMCNGIYPDL